MKPVRVVDIVRRKTTAKSDGAKIIFGNIKNAGKAVLKSPNTKTPFFIIASVIILAGAIFAVEVANVRMDRGAAKNVPRETAIIQNIVASPFSASTSTAASFDVPQLPEIKPGLLPTVKLPPFKQVSTSTAAAASDKKVSAQPSKPKPTPTPTAVTARSLLDATVLSTSERQDGPYNVLLTTDAGTYGKITWDLGRTALTLGKSAPSFPVSFSCSPVPNIPAPDATDQNPTFSVKTAYVCAVNLTPASGSDMRTQSRQFSFATGAGQLVVTPPSSMNTVLKNSVNFGGFVFRNDDTEPVTVTGLDIDVSYKGLDTADNPLILRFKDPVTQLPLEDYHLENLAADPSGPYAYAGTNIHIPLSFMVKGADKKMLPVEILGVRRMSIYGVDPTVTVTLREVSLNQNLNRIVLNSAKISWTCIVPIGAYDPNATTGPYATGEACR